VHGKLGDCNDCGSLFGKLGDCDDCGSLFGKLGDGNNSSESVGWNCCCNNWIFLKYYNSSVRRWYQSNICRYWG
jgi:hypothetical protein